MTGVYYTPPYAGGAVDIQFLNTGPVPITITGASGVVALDVFTAPITVNPGASTIFTVGSYDEDMSGHGFTIHTTCGDFGVA